MLRLVERFVYKGDNEKLSKGREYTIDAMTWPGKGEFHMVANENDVHSVYLVYPDIYEFWKEWEVIEE